MLEKKFLPFSVRRDLRAAEPGLRSTQSGFSDLREGPVCTSHTRGSKEDPLEAGNGHCNFTLASTDGDLEQKQLEVSPWMALKVSLDEKTWTHR